MKKLNILMLFVLASGAAVAQESYFYLNWDVNAPLTNKSWLGTTSARGGKIGFRKFIGAERKFAAGVDVNWSYYEEYKPTETFPQSAGAITTDYFNDIAQIGAAASGQYYFPVGKRDHFFPYAGIGLGAVRNEYSVSYNIYKDQERSYGFLARPEAGILVRIGTRRKLGLMAAVHYDFTTAKSDNYDYSNFSTVGFQLGVMILQW